jgi:hypothetical protein
VVLTSRETRLTDQIGSVGFEEPLAQGTRVSMVDAMRRLDFALLRPNDLLANDATVREVWVRTKGAPEGYIVYESGVVVSVDPASEFRPVVEMAEARIANGSSGHLEEVRGFDAFVVPPDIDNGTLGSVRLEIGGSSVAVVGDGGIPLESLITVAESVVDNAAAVERQEAAVSAS